LGRQSGWSSWNALDAAKTHGPGINVDQRGKELLCEESTSVYHVKIKAAQAVWKERLPDSCGQYYGAISVSMNPSYSKFCNGREGMAGGEKG
jgi:hypothetical protein